MKEGNQEYRDNLAKTLKDARELDKGLAQTYLEKSQETEAYKGTKEESVSDRNEKIAQKKAQAKQEKIDKLKAEINKIGKEKPTEEGVSLSDGRFVGYNEKITPKEIAEFSDTMIGMSANARGESAQDAESIENQEQNELPPEKAITNILDNVYKSIFPVRNSTEDKKQIEQMYAQFKNAMILIKQKFQEEYRQGQSIQYFYNKYRFFADKNSLPQNTSDTIPCINGGSGKNLRQRNEIFQKFGNVKKLKGESGDFKNDNAKEVHMTLSEDFSETGSRPGFLGLGKKKFKDESAMLSEPSQIIFAKELGLIEKDYQGPLLQHPNFGGGGVVNRGLPDFNYRKEFALKNIPGAKIIVQNWKGKTKEAVLKLDSEYGGTRMTLKFSKEFFDDMLQKEMVK